LVVSTQDLMMSGLRWCVGLAPIAALVGVSAALAQTPLKPWPDQQPQQPQQQRAWPGSAPQQASAPPPMAPMTPVPQGRFGPPVGMQQQQVAPSANPCLVEFNRLRGEVEKKGQVAKAVNDRKGTREEMCSAISGIHGAQSKWWKYAHDHATQCGMPADIIKQLRQGVDNLAKLKKNVCSAGGATAGAPPTPSLSEALGTAGLPPSSSSASNTGAPRKRGGVLDNMTGTPIR
jgi:hypothetical protein